MWAVFALLFVFHVAYSSDVVELDEGNFEHLTQLSTGATTGDWFIKFYAPWCGHCKRLAPTWEEVATELKGQVNIAKVDVTQNRALGKQYGIKGFPTLMLFRRGKMVKYSGARTKEALSEWALSAEPSEEVPGPLPITDKALSGLIKVIEDIVSILNKAPVACVILIVGGLLIGLMLGACLCSSTEYVPQPPPKYRPQERIKQNGPPPLDNNTDDGSSNAEPQDPKAKKTN